MSPPKDLASLGRGARDSLPPPRARPMVGIGSTAHKAAVKEKRVFYAWDRRCQSTAGGPAVAGPPAGWTE